MEFVNRQGIYRGAGEAVADRVCACTGEYPSSLCLARELLAFAAKQALCAWLGERFPGSTEVLESCFGRFKHLEKQQSRGGFTSLIMGFGALLAVTVPQAVAQAMRQSPTKAVLQWCADNLGTTLFGRRRQAFAASATKDG